MPQMKSFRFTGDNGSEQIIQTQFVPSGVSFSVKYDYLSIAQFDTLANFWLTVGCNNVPFEIPDIVIRHPPAIVSRIRALNGNRNSWLFTDQFVLTPGFADIDNTCSYYTTTIGFKGFLG